MLRLNRSNLFLAALLALQLVVALALSVLTAGGSETRPIEPLLAGLDSAAIDSLTLTDESGNTLRFARVADGWVLPAADDFPVTSGKVDEILAKIAELDTRRLVAANPANFARLEVKDDDFRRRLQLESNAQSRTLYLGGSGGVDTVYARRGGENNVYLGIGLNSWQLSPQVSSWVDTSYVNLPQSDVLEITVRNAAGSFVFQRVGADWTYTDLPEGETFEDTKLPGILYNATSIQLVEPLGRAELAEYGLAEPAVELRLRYLQATEEEASAESTAADESPEIAYSEETLTLRFGAQLEDGNIALKASDAEYYVSVRETALATFRDISQADFIRRPEPEAEANDG